MYGKKLPGKADSMKKGTSASCAMPLKPFQRHRDKINWSSEWPAPRCTAASFSTDFLGPEARPQT
jgi:hypothetical protein